MKELVGKRVKALYIDECESTLAFATDAGIVSYETYGDCCSQTWFADIVGVNALIGGVVSSVEDMDLGGYNVDDGRCRQEYDSVYGYKIITDKGYVDIVFRNSSNGYYGGSCDYTHRLPDLANMKPITDDWRAE